MAAADPFDSRLSPDFFAILELTATIDDALERAPAIYRPGVFWRDLSKKNLAMIGASGIENFKRSVANNYFNWLVTSRHDPQHRNSLRFWLRHPSTAPLLNRIGKANGLSSPDRLEAFGLSLGDRLRYKFFVGCAWEMARDACRRTISETIAEPHLGNPIQIRQRGRLISQDLANSIIEWSFIEGADLEARPRLAELGAGYGRLAYVAATARPDSVYCIFDIAPALPIAQWYLMQVLRQTNIRSYSPISTWAEIEKDLTPGSVAFFTPDQLELFPDEWFTITQSISTLPEMPAAQASHYLNLLAKKSGHALFLKQWRHWVNPPDQTELGEDAYVLPPPWNLAKRRVDPLQPEFFNRLWFRTPASRSFS